MGAERNRRGGLGVCPLCGQYMEPAARTSDAEWADEDGLYYRCPAHGRFRYDLIIGELRPLPDTGEGTA